MTDFAPATTLSAAAQAPAREVVRELAGRSAQLGADMAAYIHDRVPEIGRSPDEQALRAETAASCEANIAQLLTLLSRGAPPTEVILPEPALEYAHGVVHRRTPLTVLLRAYRLGHAYLSGITSRALREGLGDGEVLLSSIEAASMFMFEYMDVLTDHVVEAHHVERDRWVRTAAAMRAETVRNILDGELDNGQLAGKRLGYELGRYHVALILSGEPRQRPPDPVGSLEKEALEAAATLGCADPLLVPAGAAALWAWCGTFKRPDPTTLARIEAHRPSEGVRMAVGQPGYGIDGFRMSYVEAGHAARFWEVGNGRVGGTTSYRSVEVVSLLASDIERARRFVAGELGPLAEDNEKAARMRSTVLAFLAHGGSHTRAAQALHMHHNTVYNHVRRAEEVLGAPVMTRGIELQTALLLAETLGGEVLS